MRMSNEDRDLSRGKILIESTNFFVIKSYWKNTVVLLSTYMIHQGAFCLLFLSPCKISLKKERHTGLEQC